MIVVDTSAIVAVFKKEPEREQFARVIAAAESCFFSTVGYLEATMVIVGSGPPEGVAQLDDLLRELAIELVPFDEQQARISKAAFIRFGKGRHPAGLNFGDCVSYALAQAMGLPLLFKGADFARTDVAAAV